MTQFPSKSSTRTRRAGQPLTERESAVLALVAEGLSNKEIADRLDLSAHTVKFHLHSVGEKLGTTSRTKAAVDFVLQQRNNTGLSASPTGSELAERRSQLSETANWISGYAVALAQVHRHSGASTGVRAAARDAGLTLAAARGAGVSSFDLEELERAQIP